MLKVSSKTAIIVCFSCLFYNVGMTQTLATIVRIIPILSWHHRVTPTHWAAFPYVTPVGKNMGGVAYGVA